MAEVWASLKELRLRTSDPFGFIDIQTVANKAALPATPKAQTVYRSEADSEYFEYKNSAWVYVDIAVSDEMMNGFIASFGVTKSIAKCIDIILAGIGKDLYIAQSSSGTESFVFTNLTTMRNYYEALKGSAKEEASDESGYSSGRFFASGPSVVGGVIQW